MKHCKDHHFTDDNIPLNFDHAIKNMNKKINYVLKNLRKQNLS